MKRFNLLAAACLIALAGCSSAPPPAPIEWGKNAESVNSEIPVWHQNGVVVAADGVQGKWSYVLPDFIGDDGTYPVAFYYAVTHSPKIVIQAPDGTAFFNTKAWLRQHGSKGLISYQPKENSLTRITSVYFYR